MKVQSLFSNLLSSSDLQIDSDYLQSLRHEIGLDNDIVGQSLLRERFVYICRYE